MVCDREYVFFLETYPEEDADLAGWTGPGWYFVDEAESVHGPFDDREAAKAAHSEYVERYL